MIFRCLTEPYFSMVEPIKKPEFGQVGVEFGGEEETKK